MKKRNLLLTAFLGMGLIVGSFAFVANNNVSEPVEVKADVATTAVFDGPHSNDAFNNVAGSPSGYNSVLLTFKFTGTKTYFDDTDTTYSDESLMSKIKLNGVVEISFCTRKLER